MKAEVTFEPEIKTRWMIVDDDADVLLLLSDLAAQLTDGEIGCFRSPRAALAAFADAPEKFHFVITDLEMPDMDGIQLCRRLRAISPKIKILLATGGRLLTNAEAVQNGFCGMLHKPFPLPAMQRALALAGIFTAARANSANGLMPA
jgi:two-component system, NtrC family, C4-dicarboxylate transport response regulator DctD